MFTIFFGIFGKQTDDFESWAKGAMLEILIELVVCLGLAVTYGF